MNCKHPKLTLALVAGVRLLYTCDLCREKFGAKLTPYEKADLVVKVAAA